MNARKGDVRESTLRIQSYPGGVTEYVRTLADKMYHCKRPDGSRTDCGILNGVG